MWRTNAGLTDRHAYDSRPQSWPWLRRGINFWVKDHRQVYLIGNPIIWWGSSLAILAYVAVRGFLILRAKRGYRDLQQRECTGATPELTPAAKIAFYDEVISFLLMGWALHYFPFFLMQRQLFLHHYLPALWFAILIFATVFDYATSFIRPRMRFQIAVAIVIIAIWSYNYFSPLTYASPWTKAKCEKAKWLQSWDFSCGDFYEDIKMYHPESSAIKQAEHQIYVDEGAHTTIVDEAPEPIKNAFDGGDDAAREEKTTGVAGPNNDVKMQESTALPGPAHDADAPIPQDDRAPVGLDAGAIEVTGAVHDEGGWHGGANDDAPKEEAQPEVAPVGAKKVGVEKMDLDDEAKKLADEALRAAEE